MKKAFLNVEKSFRQEGDVYTGDFNPYLMKKMSQGSIEFLLKNQGKTLTREDGYEAIEFGAIVPSTFNQFLSNLEAGTSTAFIWKEKKHEKKIENNVKVYRDHWIFKFYNKKNKVDLIIRPSRHEYDWLNRLDVQRSELIPLFDITILDVRGYTKES